MGEATPNSSRFMLIAEAIKARLHPNSASKGWMRTEGEERTPALVKVVKKQSDKMNQP
jgi:hypothetical protein